MHYNPFVYIRSEKDILKLVNTIIAKGFCIGHSYFCNLEDVSEDRLEAIVKYEIIPMLEEYWFDDETKLKRWSNTLLGIFNE